jgi:hypothetical protein
MVRVEGFEPSVSCSQSRRIEPDFPTLGHCMVRLERLEPSILAASDFKSDVYTIPPQSQQFGAPGRTRTDTPFDTGF